MPQAVRDDWEDNEKEKDREGENRASKEFQEQTETSRRDGEEGRQHYDIKMSKRIRIREEQENIDKRD